MADWLKRSTIQVWREILVSKKASFSDILPNKQWKILSFFFRIQERLRKMSPFIIWQHWLLSKIVSDSPRNYWARSLLKATKFFCLSTILWFINVAIILERTLFTLVFNPFKAIQHFPHVSRENNSHWEFCSPIFINTTSFVYTPFTVVKALPLILRHVIFSTTKQKKRKAIFPIGEVIEAQMDGFSDFWGYCFFHHCPWALLPGRIHVQHTHCGAGDVVSHVFYLPVSSPWQNLQG